MRERVERVVPELLDRAIELVGEDPFARVGESTRFAQPAIYCASVTGWTEWRELARPAALAGHSLGELSALVAAEALDPVCGLELAVLRGELMASVRTRQEEGMLAVLGGEDELPDLLATEHEVVLANDNAPGQVVLAGPVDRLRDASGHARREGARAIWLDVAGAFHSPAMASAVEPFRVALEQVELREPMIPVISASTARPFEDIRAELAAAIVQPVRWRATMLALGRSGAETFVDFGPGQILARLVKRNLPGATMLERHQLASRESSEPSRVA
ncbi:MAG: Acyl transferase [Solirubrobacterales bacterium]|nr:Acyl transferase [Solirubrobacterales bacterium]